jgi:poly-gamma-glutamate capsule biosynthesis protein CapA/YwtB (metallophosphatase superfamily)
MVLTGQSFVTSDLRHAPPDVTRHIQSLLAGDVVFTNFETVIAGLEDPADGPTHASPISAPPGALDALEDVGFNLLALSNNHSFCRGESGVLNTLREVRARGLAHAGTGEDLDVALAPGYLHVGRATVALVAMASGMIPPEARATEARPGVNELRVVDGIPGVDAGRPHPDDAARVLGRTHEAAQQADYVVAYHHNHVFDIDFAEMMQGRRPERLVPPNWVKTWARRQVDAGADVVVMHGAPLLHGVEIYSGRPIFYDLGNFIFQSPTARAHPDFWEPTVWESVVARVDFVGKRLVSVVFRPVVLDRSDAGDGEAPPVSWGLPRAASGATAQQILQRLADASRPLGTELAVLGDTAELVIGRQPTPSTTTAGQP